MENYNFTFVVLHYQTLDDSIGCVESILSNINYENYNIIIVDNKSPNLTGNVLKEKYKSYPKINVILNEENMGFAKGNNVGFNYAKKELKSDFIALINNDTFIQQPDFITKIINKYSDLKFHILGPDIISTIDGIHQNPRILTLQNRERLKKYLRLYNILLFLNYFGLDKILETLKKKIINKPFVTPEQNISIQWDKEQNDVKLHGSALVFSPLYIMKYNGLHPSTFMYSEEAILYFIAKRDDLKTVYFPSVKIFHKEDSSTNSVFTKNYTKRRFYYKNFINSGKVLLNLMEKEEKKLE